MYWFQPVDGIDPYAPDRHPVWIHGGPERQLYGFPAIDGPDGGAKVAFFRHGAVTTPETVDREVHADEVEFIAADVRRILPTLPGRFLTAAACMYTTTPDEHFVVGRAGRIVVGSPCSGHGFKFAPVVGRFLSELALGRDPAAPTAWASVAGAPVP